MYKEPLPVIATLKFGLVPEQMVDAPDDKTAADEVSFAPVAMANSLAIFVNANAVWVSETSAVAGLITVDIGLDHVPATPQAVLELSRLIIA